MSGEVVEARSSLSVHVTSVKTLQLEEREKYDCIAARRKYCNGMNQI